jgi:hypothetical protein
MHKENQIILTTLTYKYIFFLLYRIWALQILPPLTEISSSRFVRKKGACSYRLNTYAQTKSQHDAYLISKTQGQIDLIIITKIVK